MILPFEFLILSTLIKCFPAICNVTLKTQIKSRWLTFYKSDPNHIPQIYIFLVSFFFFFKKIPGSIVLQSLSWSTRRKNIYDTNTIVRAHRDRQIINDRLIRKFSHYIFLLEKREKPDWWRRLIKTNWRWNLIKSSWKTQGKHIALSLVAIFLSPTITERQNTRAQSTRADNSQVQGWLGKMIIMNLN